MRLVQRSDRWLHSQYDVRRDRNLQKMGFETVSVGSDDAGGGETADADAGGSVSVSVRPDQLRADCAERCEGNRAC